MPRTDPGGGATLMFVVGLTGGIGSGKSVVGELFAAHGAALVDTDAIAHALTTAGGQAMPRIIDAFGADIADADGALDRPAMRARVFADPALRQRLEGILHPMIREEVERRIQASGVQAGAPYLVLMVPLLVETGAYRDRVRRIAVVDCAEATQISRVMKRSALPEADVRRILAAQASRRERLAVADDVIENDGELSALTPQVARLHASYHAYASEMS